MKFNDQNKEVKEFSDKYFAFGVHSVVISKVTRDATKDGKEFIEVEVADPSDLDVKDSARVWFTSDKATNYSFNVLRQIAVHASPEARKDNMRSLFDKLESTEQLAALMQGTIGKQIWFTKYIDPQRSYTAQDGTPKPSINKNIYGYEPKLKAELLPKTGPVDLRALGVGRVVDNEVSFESDGDASGSTVPGSDAWS